MRGTAFDSEIWADVDYLGQARKRDAYSALLLKPVDRAAYESIKASIKGDNRLKLLVKSEYQYYADQTTAFLGITILVTIVTFFMVIGAILATMNTMFNAVASRKRELATLRALGFKRRTVIATVMLESAVVALVGGIAGLLLALPVNMISTGTVNWQTFRGRIQLQRRCARRRHRDRHRRDLRSRRRPRAGHRRGTVADHARAA